MSRDEARRASERDSGSAVPDPGSMRMFLPRSWGSLRLVILDGLIELRAVSEDGQVRQRIAFRRDEHEIEAAIDGFQWARDVLFGHPKQARK